MGCERGEMKRGDRRCKKEEEKRKKGPESRLGQIGMSTSMCPGVEMMESGRLCV